MATKGALEGYSPELISVIRLGMAALMFRLLGGPGTRSLPQERWSWIGGVALGADFLLYNHGLRWTAAGVAGLVINVEVASTIALAVWLLGERLTRRDLIGSLVTLLGVLHVSGASASFHDLAARERLLGNILVMLAGISWSLFAVAQRKAPRRANLFQLLTPIFTVAAMTTAPALILPSAWQNLAGLHATLMLLTLILGCTMGVYATYAQCQQMVDVSLLAIVLASIPVFAVVFAWCFLGEPISPRVISGGVLILAGVMLISTERPASEVVASTAVERI